jgi:hypothetical protein
MFRPLLAAAAAALVLAAPAQAATHDDDAYWAFADKLQQRVDDHWDEQDGYFHLGGGGSEPMSNSMLLLTYSVAAIQGLDPTHPARNDHRARILANRLVSAPPFVTKKTGGGQVHAPGWVNSMTNAHGGQHLVFDAEVVDGLTYAYRAREALQLPDSTVARIRSAIHSTARGSFWRYPTIRLNQINWYALIYAADATVTGDNTLLKRDFSQQLTRFFSGVRGTAARAGNFGPGMRFHYLPGQSINGRMNLDSAEYSNIVLTFTRFYDQARRAGMPALSASSKNVMHQWITRVVSGYWTHAGYMNWDSGLGFQRWHQGKKLGLTQEALIGLASSDSLLPGKQWGEWSKSMLDNGFDFYERLASRAPNGLVDPVLFDVNEVPQGPSSAYLAAARIEANAARAIDAGLGKKASSTPPPLYSYDPDIGRLAVTTPTYNTAVIAVNQKAFPYGGLDLARLFDGQQEVAANIGGRPPASFGLLVRDVTGRQVTASQHARERIVSGSSPLRLTKAPSGAGAISSALVGRAYAGPFSDLRATGTSATRELALRVTHRFTRDWIQTNWTVTRRSGLARYTADVLFPSWKGDGTTQAGITAVMKDGTSVTVGSKLVPLTNVAYLWVRSERSGYVVVPRSRPAGAGVHVIRPSAQSSDPKPGPTAAIQIARAATFNRAALAVRLTPVHDAQEAAAAAARLK